MSDVLYWNATEKCLTDVCDDYEPVDDGGFGGTLCRRCGNKSHHHADEIHEIGAYIAELLARAVPPWTETPPTVPGWWWIDSGGTSCVVQVILTPTNCLGVCAVDEMRFFKISDHAAGTRWAGPVPRPG